LRLRDTFPQAFAQVPRPDLAKLRVDMSERDCKAEVFLRANAGSGAIEETGTFSISRLRLAGGQPSG
jgi:hypothetical protein